MKKLKYFSSNISFVYLPTDLHFKHLFITTTTMAQQTLEQDFNAEHLELNFDTVFEDFLDETDTANDDFEDFVIGQEDTITHIIQLDLFNELDILNGLNYHNFDLVVNNDRLTLEELEQDAEPALLFCNIDYDNITDIHANVNDDEDDDDTEEQEEEDEDDLLQYILDDDDVIPYDCPVEADAFYAD